MITIILFLVIWFGATAFTNPQNFVMGVILFGVIDLWVNLVQQHYNRYRQNG